MAPAVPTAGEPLRVATYNIHHGAPRGGRFDRRAMAAACASLGADVLALQEVDRRALRSGLSDQPAVIAKATGLHHEFASTLDLGPLGRYGLALLTRSRPASVEVLDLPESAERRVALIVELPGAGQSDVPFTVVSTHLQNDDDIAISQLDVLLERLSRSRGPILLMGDFNAGPDLVEPRLAAHGLVAAEAPPTFPAHDPRRRIDWIAGRGVTFPGGARTVDVRASDHLPLVAACVHG